MGSVSGAHQPGAAKVLCLVLAVVLCMALLLVLALVLCMALLLVR